MRRVPLSRAYAGFGSAPVTEAHVREPTGGLYLDFGEPYERQRTLAGEEVIIENTAAVKGYVEACTAFPGETDARVVLGQLGVADIRRVKEAVLDFFTVAPVSTGPSPPSSAAAGTQVRSSE